MFVLARKPLVGTVAENVLQHGTGGLNIDGCRVAINPDVDDPRLGGKGVWLGTGKRHSDFAMGDKPLTSSDLGRWPPNVLLSNHAADFLSADNPHTKSGKVAEDKSGYVSTGSSVFIQGISTSQNQHGDEGSVARFFPQFNVSLEETMFFDDETPETPKEIKLNGYLYAGDNLEYLRTLPDNSIDSIVTDPPYGLGKEPDPRKVLAAWLSDESYQPGGRGFMGKEWDSFVPSPVLWQECLRVLKPGGHMIAFAGTRTYDWVVMGVRLAGFEIRDSIAWLYGQGMPKNLDVSKAIDKAAGAKREVVGTRPSFYPDNSNWGITAKNKGSDSTIRKNGVSNFGIGGVLQVTAPATPEAQQWEGWGTALKPAMEPAVLARKPLVGTVVENVLQHGTGGLNIDAARVDGKPLTTHKDGNYTGNSPSSAMFPMDNIQAVVPEGRWPANLAHDGSEAVTSEFPEAGSAKVRISETVEREDTSQYRMKPTEGTIKDFGDSGSTARFFTQAVPDPLDAALFKYCAKASTSERNTGTEALQEAVGKGNIHPTAKPVKLIEWLITLVTPPSGVVLDPFIGSGTTGVAAELLGFRWIGCERETDYAMIAYHRIAHAAENREEILANREREKAKAEKPVTPKPNKGLDSDSSSESEAAEAAEAADNEGFFF